MSDAMKMEDRWSDVRAEASVHAAAAKRALLEWARLVVSTSEPDAGMLERARKVLALVPEVGRLMTPPPADPLEEMPFFDVGERSQEPYPVESAQGALMRHLMPIAMKLADAYTKHVELLVAGKVPSPGGTWLPPIPTLEAKLPDPAPMTRRLTDPLPDPDEVLPL